MKPAQLGPLTFRAASALWLAVALAVVAGCSQEAVNLQSPEDDLDLLESQVKLVGDFALADGVQPIKVMGVTLCTQLAGTGSDPQQSDYRNILVAEMQTRGVDKPNQVLASPTTAMVMVSGYLRPGIRKGDRFDVKVECQDGDGTTSLRGGWLMETRLRQMIKTKDEVIHDGDLLGMSSGWILVDPMADATQDEEALRNGRILGGGVATQSRDLGLLLREDQQRAAISDRVGKAINQRFVYYKQGVQEGVATPKDNKYIELVVHPRYKDNLARYIAVIRAIPVRESAIERTQRMRLLERQLLDPITSSRAAIELEAIGKDKSAVEVLHKGLASQNPEVRFYSAEALAYLDDAEAAVTLARSAHEEPAFRAYALTALSAMKDIAAYEPLRKLLDVSNAETRYGAFRALWTWNPEDPLVRGEGMNKKFSYHVLDVAGPPMIHVTSSFRPEVVLFGVNHRLVTPVKLQAGKTIDINATSDDHVVVARYVPGKAIERRTLANDVNQMIRAVVEVGGDYGDVVQMLSEARNKHALTSRFEIDALPRTDRAYLRGGTADASDADASEGDERASGGKEHGGRRKGVASPSPELFQIDPDQEKPLKKKDKDAEVDDESVGKESAER